VYYKIINKKKKILTIIIDLFGYILWSIPNILKRKSQITNIKEILIIRTAYIGDVIMTLPVLKPLKTLYPDARVTFLTGSKAREVLENNPYIDEILIYDAFWFYPKRFKEAIRDYLKFLKVLRSRRYDLVIEARADIRDILLIAYLSKSKYRVSYKVGGGGYLLTHIVPFKEIKHKVDYHLDIVKFLGAKVEDVIWGLQPRVEDNLKVNALLDEERVNNPEILIGIHPGGRKELKCWSPEGFATVADYLISKYGATVIFTGSMEERNLIENIIKKMAHKAINFAGKTNLRTLTALIERLNLFICNDSAPLHIASAVGTPTIAIFGPSKSKETGPYGNIHKVVEKDFPCRYSCDENICKHEIYNECMKTITPDDVCKAVREVIMRAGVVEKVDLKT